MIPALAARKDSIAVLCRRFGVSRLDVFGSAARGTDFDPAISDVDFLVEFKPEAEANAFDHYFGLLESLTTMLGRKVDLVSTRAARNPYFLREANRSREPLYAA